MRVIGLTGSIGTGKSTTAAMVASFRVPVFDADAAVHNLLGPAGQAVEAISAQFPQVVRKGADSRYIDRKALGRAVFFEPSALRRLEAILHPLVRQRERDFRSRAQRHKAALIVLDVPLLFETGGDRRCDATIVVTAPLFLQAQRVLRREGMSPSHLKQILTHQMKLSEKCRRADFIIPTGIGLAHARRRLSCIMADLMRPIR